MPGKAHAPELKKFMDKRLLLKVNGSRTVTGILRGFDPFMNLVLDQSEEIVSGTERRPMGLVVLRGNSVVMIEALEQIPQ